MTDTDRTIRTLIASEDRKAIRKLVRELVPGCSSPRRHARACVRNEAWVPTCDHKEGRRVPVAA